MNKDRIHVKSVLFFLICFLVLSPFAANAAEAQPKTEILHKIDTYIAERIKEKNIPGASIAIVSGDKVVFSKAYGVSDLKTKKPVTTETTFLTGSTAKNITATAIFQLRDQGKLQLDDPVQKYIPEFFVSDRELSKMITIRHLLMHTAGLGYQAQRAVFANVEAANQSMNSVIGHLSSFTLLNRPGERWEYSNVGYGLLGVVIERASGQSYADYIKTHILQPLAMKHTAINAKDYGNTDQAEQYLVEFGRLTEIPRLQGAWGNPAGLGWATNPTDWAHYVIAQLGEGKTQILSQKSLNEAHNGGILTPGGHYSYGWFNKEVNGIKVIFHPGGASSSIALIPDKKLGIIFMGNVLSTEVWGIGFGVASMLIEQKEDAIFYSPDRFSVMSKIWTGMTIVSVILIAWLSVILLKRNKPRNPGRMFGVIRTTLLIIFEVLFLLFIFKINPQIGENPTFYGKIYGYYTDQFIGTGALLLASSLWTMYSIYMLRRTTIICKHNRNEEHITNPLTF